MTDYGDTRTEFYHPHSNSALRAGMRKYPCPTCKKLNKLTAADVKRHYQCDECADRLEGIGYGAEY